MNNSSRINSLLSIFDENRFKKNFKKCELIGSGGFGAVYKALHRYEPNESYYAIKVIKTVLNVYSSTFLDPVVFREISACKNLLSKYVVRYYTWWIQSASDLSSDLTSHLTNIYNNPNEDIDSGLMNIKLYIQMEYCEGETLRQWLFSRLENEAFDSSSSDESSDKHELSEQIRYVQNVPYDYESTQLVEFIERTVNTPELSVKVPSKQCSDTHISIVNQENAKNSLQYSTSQYEYIISLFGMILKGVCEIHEVNIIHRDLKPENILFQKSVSKIGDFGLTLHFQEYFNKHSVNFI
ncbi:uncharacterized protein LOC142597878 [Dermatophagoides farinae]|uniref:uncharacterized protein LOC142597878 n=1 Tax=Dermatophagoides farinae TaxID=6954 RepID=UPI003F627523